MSIRLIDNYGGARPQAMPAAWGKAKAESEGQEKLSPTGPQVQALRGGPLQTHFSVQLAARSTGVRNHVACNSTWDTRHPEHWVC